MLLAGRPATLNELCCRSYVREAVTTDDLNSGSAASARPNENTTVSNSALVTFVAIIAVLRASCVRRKCTATGVGCKGGVGRSPLKRHDEAGMPPAGSTGTRCAVHRAGLAEGRTSGAGIFPATIT